MRAQETKAGWIHQLGMCESSWRPSLKHLDSNDYYSYGALQFQMSTWLTFGKPFGATPENIYDASLQTIVAESMIENGGWWRWRTCYLKTKAILGEYPY